MKNILLATSIISYMAILLVGQLVALPLILWLLFTAFEFGNIDQIFAIFGLAGIMLNLTKRRAMAWVMILSFALMLSPLISRLVQVPGETFNYIGFILPFVIFILTYITYIVLNSNEKRMVPKDPQQRV